MKISPLWLFFGVISLFASCVPNRKVVFLQKDDVKKKDIPTDTVLRSYNLNIEEYKIQPLDLLNVKIESLTEEDYDFISKLYPNQAGGAVQPTNAFRVDNNGEVEFPVIGKFRFGGLSVFEAQDKLRQALTAYLKNPVARISLMNFRFTLLGEVNGEQTVISNNTRVTIMEAIGLAGGLSELADRSKVKVVRQVGNTSEIFYLNLLDENLMTSKHYYVQQNDIIVVPPLRQRPFRRYFTQNTALVLSSVSALLLVINLFNQ